MPPAEHRREHTDTLQNPHPLRRKEIKQHGSSLLPHVKAAEHPARPARASSPCPRHLRSPVPTLPGSAGARLLLVPSAPRDKEPPTNQATAKQAARRGRGQRCRRRAGRGPRLTRPPGPPALTRFPPSPAHVLGRSGQGHEPGWGWGGRAWPRQGTPGSPAWPALPDADRHRPPGLSRGVGRPRPLSVSRQKRSDLATDSRPLRLSARLSAGPCMPTSSSPCTLTSSRAPPSLCKSLATLQRLSTQSLSSCGSLRRPVREEGGVNNLPVSAGTCQFCDPDSFTSQ